MNKILTVVNIRFKVASARRRAGQRLRADTSPTARRCVFACTTLRQPYRAASVRVSQFPPVAVPVSLRSIPVLVPTDGTNESVWRTSLQQVPGQVPAKPSAPSWGGGSGAGTLQTAAAVSLLLVALLLSTAVSCIWRRLLAARSATVPSAATQRFPLSDGEDGLGGAGECLLELERDEAHHANQRPRPPAPAPS